MNFRLREMRKNLHISQTNFAEMVGASLRTVGAWERGETMPDAEQIWNMAVALGCTPNDLLGWYDEHPYEDAPQLARDEAALLADYRSCTPEWKRNVAMTAVSAKGESLKSAEHTARVDGLAG